MAARYISIIVRAVKLEYFVSMFFFFQLFYVSLRFFPSIHCVRRVFSSPLRLQCVHGNVAGELSHDCRASGRERARPVAFDNVKSERI